VAVSSELVVMPGRVIIFVTILRRSFGVRVLCS